MQSFQSAVYLLISLQFSFLFHFLVLLVIVFEIGFDTESKWSASLRKRREVEHLTLNALKYANSLPA